MNENYVRRERMRKTERKKMIEDMRAALPVYNLEQIRQYRMPFHEALLTNLHDSGYTFTSQYLRQLLKVQQDLRDEAGPLSQVWAKPQLLASKPIMTDLSERLVKCEDFYNNGNYDQECEALLQTAIHFAFSVDSWWWLGEQLLIQSLTTSSNRKFVGDKYQALSRYTYGKFLIDNFKEYDDAMKHLNVARQLSYGKEWTTKTAFPAEADVLFLKANLLLYNCLIRQVENLMETDHIQAGRIAAVARKRAAEACYIEGEITALMLRGMCQLSSNDTKNSILTFTKAYYIQSKLGSARGICETRIHMATAYLLNGDNDLSLNTLLMLKESADEFNLPFYLAQAYRHLGEYFLNHGDAKKATPLLVEALKIFYERKHLKESEQVRNLEAISVGLENFSDYVDLLSKTHKPDYLKALINWKDSRAPFSDALDDNSSTSTAQSIEAIIEKSMADLKESMARKSVSIRMSTVSAANPLSATASSVTESSQILAPEEVAGDDDDRLDL